MNHQEKIILFPKWKSSLEDEGLRFLKSAEYKKALDRFNHLIDYQVANDAVITGKLICLMELGIYEEAEEICLFEMAKKNEKYYQYANIYFTLLFQSNQYDELMERLTYELSFDCLPEDERKQFQQLYEMSASMKMDYDEKNSAAYIAELREAVESDDVQKQWRTIDSLRKSRIEPSSREKKLLNKPSIHPVIKTAVMEWMQSTHVSENVHINKLGISHIVNPSELPGILQHPTVMAIMSSFDNVEQKNPSLHQMLQNLLLHYTYVRFPFVPGLSEADYIAEAILYIGKKYLRLPAEDVRDAKVKNYQSEIELCERLYASIIPD